MVQTGKPGAKGQTVVALMMTLKRHIHVLIPGNHESYVVVFFFLKTITLCEKYMYDYIRNFERRCLRIVQWSITASLVIQMVKNPPTRWETWV